MNEWGGEPVQPAEEINLRDYWVTIRKRRWVIFSFLIVVLTIGTLRSVTTRPTYRATTTLLIEKERNLLSLQDMFSFEYVQEDYYQTQYKLLQSRSLVRAVIDKLKLEQVPEFGGDPSKPQPMDPEAIQKARTRIVGMVLGSIEVAPIRQTRLVQVSFRAHDAALAAKAVNALAECFAEMNIENKYEATEQANAFLSEQTDTLRKEIAKREQQLHDYSTSKSIIALSDKETTIVDKLTDLNKALTQAQIERSRKEALYKQAATATPEALQDVPGSGVLNTLKEEYARLDRVYLKKSEVFKPEYPEMIALKAELDNARRAIENEVRGLVNSAYADYQAALKKEQSLADMFDAQKSEAGQLNSDAIQYNSLKIEVDNKKQLMASLLTRQSETGISARLKGLRTSNVRVVDQAEVPLGPVSPNVPRSVIVSLFLGLLGGLALAFLFEHLDNSVKSSDEIERLVALPTLGVIPAYDPNTNRNGYYHRYLRGRSHKQEKQDLPAPKQPQAVEMIPITAPMSNISEAYRAIRTALLLSAVDHPQRMFIVTSALPSEGKSTTVVNLALSLTQADKRVLVVDLDLRRPRLHRILQMKNVNGLTNYLAGAIELGGLIKPTKVPGLSLVNTGPVPPNPTELLHGHRMTELLDILRVQYDYVLIDTPPLLAFTDALIVGPRTDGILLVIWGGKTPREALKRAREKMDLVKAQSVGVVINNINLHAYDYYYKHHYYYYQDQERRPS